MVNESNYKEFEELISAISKGAHGIKEASADGKVNWQDIGVMIPMATAAVKGLNGIEQVVPILQSSDETVIERRKEIIKDVFVIPQASAGLENAIENILLNLIGLYANVRTIVTYSSAE